MKTIRTTQESGMVQATVIQDRLGSLHIWIESFGKPVNTTGELFEMNERECDIFFQFDYDQEEFFNSAVPSKDEDSNIKETLSRGWEVHVWLPDYYMDIAADMCTYYDKDMIFI